MTFDALAVSAAASVIAALWKVLSTSVKFTKRGSEVSIAIDKSSMSREELERLLDLLKKFEASRTELLKIESERASTASQILDVEREIKSLEKTLEQQADPTPERK